VSPAAPYQHFRDRDELLADVARRGFVQFEVMFVHAWDGGCPDAFTAFDRVGKAYLHFAKNEPAYYSAMFEAGIPPELLEMAYEESGPAVRQWFWTYVLLAAGACILLR
jgi:AcrR family transcriptional regulator